MIKLVTYVLSVMPCYIKQSMVQHGVTVLKKDSFARKISAVLKYSQTKCRIFVSLISKARNHCANWNTGKCCGVVFKIKQKRKDGYKYPIHQILDIDLADKDCKIDKGCTYFKNIVLPGLVVE